MALSRLRNPVISRAPSLLRARLLSSAYPSLPRSSRVLSSFTDVEGTLSRTTALPVFGGLHAHSSKIKLQSGVRYFLSADMLHCLTSCRFFCKSCWRFGHCYVEPGWLVGDYVISDTLQTVVGMPTLSPTMSQGNIAKWRKKEGDKINVGNVLCEIETDKATLEFESLEEGFLAKILVPEGSKDVPVGQPIAITVEDPDDIKNVSAPAGGGTEVKEETSQKHTSNEERKQETSSPKANTAELPPHFVLGMPALSPTMSQGNIATWRKQEGDQIEVCDVLCEIETDKATLEFESLEEGFLARILVPDGSKDVAVGQRIAVTVEDPNDIQSVKTSFSGDMVPKEDKLVHHDSTTKTKNQKTCFSKISPSAKLLIMEHGLDVSSTTPSSRRGTILKGDVLAAIKSGIGSAKILSSREGKSPSLQVESHTYPSLSSGLRTNIPQADAYEDLPSSQIRKVIATRLLESKQSTPHLYISSDVILDPLLSFRKELKEKFDVKVSVNDIVIKVVATALRNVPKANAYWDVKKGEAILCDEVDISIAVATDKIKELAERARAGKLKPNEFQGGTFSISNLGMFPVDHFCAITNPPQAGILTVGSGNQVVEPVVGADGIEKPGVVTKMNLTLSADHRVFDGHVGGAFVAALRSNFADIRRLLL